MLPLNSKLITETDNFRPLDLQPEDQGVWEFSL